MISRKMLRNALSLLKNIRVLFPRLDAYWVSSNKIYSFDMFAILSQLITIQTLDNI